MTTSDNISAIEAIEKALEKATPGPWDHTECDDGARMVHTIGDIIVASTTLKERDAAYIAACNPVVMSAILAEVRKVEEMEREIVELREALKPFADVADLVDSETEGVADSDEFQMQFHDYLMASWKLSIFRRARTLLNGGSDHA